MEDTQALLNRIKELEEKVLSLEKDLIHDSLTSLKTRAFFQEEVGTHIIEIENIGRIKRKEAFGFKNLSVLFIDIDNFKKINDAYGHEVGDLVLKKVSETLLKDVRVGDVVARWGGEEMVISLLGANESEAKQKAELIRQRVEQLTFDAVPELKVTLSIGVAATEGEKKLEPLLSSADKALYHAKENGKNRVVAFSEMGE